MIFHGYVSHNQMVISSHIPYDQRWFQLRIIFSDSQKVPVLTNSNVDQDLGSSSKSSVPLPHHPPVVYNMSSSLYWKSPIWDLHGFTICGYLRYAYPMNPWQTTNLPRWPIPFWLSSPPGRSSIPPISPAPNLGDLIGFFQERGDHILSGSGQPTSHGIHLLPDLVVEPVVDVHGIEELTCTNHLPHLLDMSGICGYMIM